jgi:hypothetical protein
MIFMKTLLIIQNIGSGFAKGRGKRGVCPKGFKSHPSVP